MHSTVVTLHVKNFCHRVLFNVAFRTNILPLVPERLSSHGGAMQVPAAFEYAKATTVSQTLELLSQWGEDARVIAGGHSLIPMMKLRLARPTALIDINDVSELSYIRGGGDGPRIGGLARPAGLPRAPLP